MPVDERPWCTWCRQRPADAFLWEDTSMRGDYTLICFDCIEAMVERENALHEHPELASMLPPLFDRPPNRVRPHGRTIPQPGDNDRLDELKRRARESGY